MGKIIFSKIKNESRNPLSRLFFNMVFKSNYRIQQEKEINGKEEARSQSILILEEMILY